jgi:hypothetical protein
MNEKPKCDHEWEDYEQKIVADNPRFDHQTQHTIVRRICKKCGEKWIKDYKVEQ